MVTWRLKTCWFLLIIIIIILKKMLDSSLPNRGPLLILNKRLSDANINIFDA